MVSGTALTGAMPATSRSAPLKPSSRNARLGLVEKPSIKSFGSLRNAFRSMSKGWPGIMVRDGKTDTTKLLT